MATNLPTTKRVQIDKASTVIVASLAVASFITVFSLVASKALLSQRSYQAKVIGKKEKARDQLKANVAATTQLTNAYKTFNSTSQNIIGGNPNGTGPSDGNSSKIVLDALPSQYDFPALVTSMQGLLSQSGVKVNALTGTDDQINQENNQTSDSPQAVEIPFQANVTGPYGSIQNVIDAIGRSIRPVQIQTLGISGSNKDLTVQIQAKTFYQPGKSLNVKTTVVK